MAVIQSLAELETLYGMPGEASTVKEIDHITPQYQAWIEASPFVALATAGPEGLDCSPRGDAGAVVRIRDPRTVLLPDRRGNNRTDSLRNIVRDPRVGLLFLIPGAGTTLRINGRAYLDTDAALCDGFAVDGRAPRSVIVIRTDAVYFQCARAVIRAGLWDAARHADVKALPTPGQILQSMSDSRIDGAAYDADWPARAAASMW
ncbi:pyridoxamine 5'-phosphate oxidase family protein [Ferrovibrio sp.]|uniref:pyridoxamine 5'-phosphate oxidase family protein n=2 Tax=Ferrovibrio sp. TaxID=1917215 RepID=UPI0035133906